MNATIPAAGIGFARLFTAIFSGTIGLVGLAFLGVGLGILAAQNRKRGRCTAYAEGTVSALRAQFGSGSLRAVYGFSVDGRPVQYVSNFAGMSGVLVGQRVSVYYDPERIGRVYIEEDARQIRLFARVFAVLGGVLLSAALVMAALLPGWL